MKLWTISIAVLAIAAVASAAPTKATSTTVTTVKHAAPKNNQCVPEPLTMFALVPGVAMLIRRRKKA